MIMKSGESNKKCVLLYSRRHFNPDSETELNSSSAGRIASSIYKSVKSLENFEVYYFDAFDYKEWHRIKADILITLIDNLTLAKWYFRPEHIVVIAVNQHPLERLLISSQAISDNLPANAIVPSDGVYQPFLMLKKASIILCIGNIETIKTYKKYISKCNIVPVYYENTFSEKIKTKEIKQIKNILILMSSIGYRKGFDRIYNALLKENHKLNKYRFHIIGHPEGNFWKQKIDKLSQTLKNVEYHGWILNKDSKFEDLLSQMDIALFPTREEGMVGSLMECVDSGIISLHTKNSGLNNQIPKLELETHGDLNLFSKLEEISKLNINELKLLQESQLNEMKNQFQNNSSIGHEIISVLTKGLAKGSGSNKWKVIISVILKIPKYNYKKVLINRFRFTYIRTMKAKIEIRMPLTYKILILARNKIRYSAN